MKLRVLHPLRQSAQSAFLLLITLVQVDALRATEPPTPQAIQSQFRLDPGLRIELVASEPQIESPVAMAFDENGKLWVVEMRDYPNGPPPGQKPEGRIKVLEDKDGDGKYETSTLFADGLLFANGLLPWRGGVFVTAAPHILYLKDTDGDGKADQRDVLFEGFATQNPQLRVSHPLLGPDGYVYVVNGLRGGQVKLAGDPQAKPVDLSGRDFRFNPQFPEDHMAVSGMGQYGQTFDDWGNRFVCDNNHHLRHVVINEDWYLKRNPYLVAPAVLEDTSVLEPGPLSSGVKIYPMSKNWTTSSLHAGRFTAACGVFIYRGSLLPEPYRGAAFTCDPTANIVHQEILTPHGATFRSKPAKDGVEFLAHPSDWFRPVFLTSGPDGALYIVDMCRAVIEHPEFMPDELKKRPDLLVGKDKGRIWRIVPEKHEPRTPQPRLGKATTPELVKLLEHPDAWWRTTGQRLLLERRDHKARPLLRQLVLTSKEPATRLQAGMLLDRPIGWVEEDMYLRLLSDPHPRVRERSTTLLWSGGLEPARSVLDRLVSLAKDPDPSVRFQAALTLGKWNDDRILEPLARIALADSDDRWTRLAVGLAAPGRAGALLQLLQVKGLLPVNSDQSGRLALLENLAFQVGARRDPQEMAPVLDALLDLHADQDPVRLAGMNALAAGSLRQGKRFEQQVANLRVESKEIGERVDKVMARAAGLAANPKSDSALRHQAVRLLAHAPWSQARAPLLVVIQSEASSDLRLAAIRSLSSHTDKEVPEVLMQNWRGYTPPVRREVTEAMLRDGDRILVLLREIEAGRVKPGDLDAARVKQLVNDSRPAIREKAKTLLEKNLPEERRLVMERYQPALKLTGDARRGQEVFKKNCATCHRVNGIGVDVGADIADTRTKTLEGLLVDILNPNQAIDSNYINYTVLLKDGQVLTGVIATETASSILLKRAENQTDSVLRQDVETIKSSGQSLMPEGLEKTITVAEMADLLAFLKNWRYLDGTVPVAQGADATPLAIKVEEHADHVSIETDMIQARINKTGYVSGIAAGSFLDKKTGARDLGFGLHIMDFLLAPGWRDDGYTRDGKLHGDLPKHYVEGPQICTQAKKLTPEIIRGKDFVAVKLRFTFSDAGKGYLAGSEWVQTLVFQPGVRYVLTAEEITSKNAVDDLFYRIDMPGHIKHQKAEGLNKVYLSHHGEIDPSAFVSDFGPDAKFLYQRKDKVPERVIRAYQVKKDGQPGPWLAGMTLDPAAMSEGWCHQRGYICMIQELHRRPVKAGEKFGAAYVVGWFDSVPEMERVYDKYKGTSSIRVDAKAFWFQK